MKFIPQSFFISFPLQASLATEEQSTSNHKEGELGADAYQNYDSKGSLLLANLQRLLKPDGTRIRSKRGANISFWKHDVLRAVTLCSLVEM
jgi:hypothetical protein